MIKRESLPKPQTSTALQSVRCRYMGFLIYKCRILGLKVAEQ